MDQNQNIQPAAEEEYSLLFFETIDENPGVISLAIVPEQPTVTLQTEDNSVIIPQAKQLMEIHHCSHILYKKWKEYLLPPLSYLSLFSAAFWPNTKWKTKHKKI